MSPELPERQPADAHHLRVGDYVVTTLFDSSMTASLGLIENLEADTTAALHGRSRRALPPRITLNAFLIRGAGHTVLVDTGLGPNAEPGGGRLAAGLGQVGVAAGEVDTILLTHAHPDHIGGLLDAAGALLFPQADVWLPGSEIDHWQAGPPADANDTARAHFAAAQQIFTACRDQLRRLDAGSPVPGTERVPLPGHTPGHSGYRVTSRDERLLIWADIVHLPQIQLPRPEAALAFDTDPAMAARTRAALLAELADSGEMVAGHHLDFPGLGFIAADGAGYRFLPHVWSSTV